MTEAEITKMAESFVQGLKDSTSWEVQEDGLEYLYCGSYLSINPSGKYYTCFTSNQTEEDENADTFFWEEVERLFPEGDFFSGEGDACDCYCCRTSKEEENAANV